MKRLHHVDFIVMGEGEETFHHLLQTIEGDRKFHFVYGVAYRKQDEIIVNPGRPKSILAELPSRIVFRRISRISGSGSSILRPAGAVLQLPVLPVEHRGGGSLLRH